MVSSEKLEIHLKTVSLLLKVTLLWHRKLWMLLIASSMLEFHINGNMIPQVVKNHGYIYNSEPGLHLLV